jgi:hypothetical protein
MAARDEVHDEVNAVLRLENELHLHNEGVIHLQHDHLLQLDRLHGVVH